MILDARIDVALELLRRAYGVPRAELELVRLVAKGHPRRELARLRGVAPSTTKKQIQSLLSRTGHACLLELVADVLRCALRQKANGAPL